MDFLPPLSCTALKLVGMPQNACRTSTWMFIQHKYTRDAPIQSTFPTRDSRVSNSCCVQLSSSSSRRCHFEFGTARGRRKCCMRSELMWGLFRNFSETCEDKAVSRFFGNERRGKEETSAKKSTDYLGSPISSGAGSPSCGMRSGNGISCVIGQRRANGCAVWTIVWIYGTTGAPGYTLPCTSPRSQALL